MKRLICTVSDEDLVKLVGTLVKVGADFSVQNIASDEPDKVRHIQRKTADGKSASDIVLEAITASRQSKTALAHILQEHGFNSTTVYGTVAKLKASGHVVTSGDWVMLPKAERQA